MLVVDARHATGLSTALREVDSAAGMAGIIVLDDAQRLIAAREPWLRADQHLRYLLGVDVDDQAELGIHVTRAVKALVARGEVDAQQTTLPPVSGTDVATEILERLPATAPVVADALGQRLEGRIGLLDDVLSLPDVRMRVRGDGLRMVPQQFERVPFEVAALMEERWRLLDAASRRVVLIVTAFPTIPLTDLVDALDREGLGRAAPGPDVGDHFTSLHGWIDVRNGYALPGKGVAALAERLSERGAPVIEDVQHIVERLRRATEIKRDEGPKDRARLPPPGSAPGSRADTANAGSKPKPSKSRSEAAPSSAKRSTRPQEPAASHSPGAKAQPSLQAAGRTNSGTKTPRPSAAVRRDIAMFRGAAALRAPDAIALHRELVQALWDEGQRSDAAREQQTWVNRRAAALGEKSIGVARDRLGLAVLLAKLGDKNATGAFGAAIGALQEALGRDSEEVRRARQLRKKLLPRGPAR